jgi:uncharacterized protein YecA (UPF0149 family)
MINPQVAVRRHLEAKRREEELLKRAGVIPRTHIPRYTGVGRNQPCPCKSGKKFKHCCKGK